MEYPGPGTGIVTPHGCGGSPTAAYRRRPGRYRMIRYRLIFVSGCT